MKAHFIAFVPGCDFTCQAKKAAALYSILVGSVQGVERFPADHVNSEISLTLERRADLIQFPIKLPGCFGGIHNAQMVAARGRRVMKLAGELRRICRDEKRHGHRDRQKDQA